MKVVIIDDEEFARRNISLIIHEYFPQIEIVGEADSVSSGIQEITTKNPDLIFLDVDIKGGTGFDIIQKINYESLKIIFITAFSEYALRAIKFSAFDYILKPFKSSEIIQTINKILEEEIDKNYIEKFDAIFSNINSESNIPKKIALKTMEKIFIINVQDIIYCESENNYTNFFLTNGKSILVSKPIKKYDEILSEVGFMRVHQSFLVNMNHLKEYDKSDGGFLIMINGKNIPVSTRQKVLLLKFFDSLN